MKRVLIVYYEYCINNLLFVVLLVVSLFEYCRAVTKGVFDVLGREALLD
jgi:hypothetical protein